MSIKELEIKTLSEYMAAITSLKTEHEKLWFRGHANSEYFIIELFSSWQYIAE